MRRQEAVIGAVMAMGAVGALGALGACAGRYRYEPAGRGVARVAPPAAAVAAEPSEAPGAGGVPARAGVRHDVVLQVSTPRAEVVDWTITCPGSTASGSVGESFEAYRARRLGELRAAQQRKRAAVASVAGAVLGGIGARAQAETPAGTATVDAHVDGRAAGEAVAAQAISDDVALPPGDVGGGTYRDRASLVPTVDGTCTMTVWPAGGGDPAGVVARFEVTRAINRDAEARARTAVLVGEATTVRGTVRGRLVALGADPGLRARVHAAAEARAHAEARVRIDAEAQLRLEALGVRAGLGVYLQHCGGDPYRRQRDAERAAQVASARLRLSLTLRARLEAELIGLGADLDYRRKLAAASAAERARAAEEAARLAAEIERRDHEAMAVRMAEEAFLEALGAIVRPPMPSEPDEIRPPQPDGLVVWLAGHWSWSGARWVWTPGYWTDEGSSGLTVDVSLDPGRGGRGSGDVVDHRGGGAAAAVRDHRGDGTTSDTPPPRDHRASSSGSAWGASSASSSGSGSSGSSSSSSSSSGSRDHRGSSSSSGSSSSRSSSSRSTSSSSSSARDHRDSDAGRDHRR